ncbi:hypothetical protein NOF04DRAFT_1392191 [Fusarium oxysporum II5]|nr:hypothetical protein NOF04DRAFT_1392191 [Fusarium oxysporum II5]
MLLQILRFNLLPSLTISGQAFTDLRKQVALAGATHQYFGYSVQTLVAPLPKERHEITWIIRWPVGPELLEKPHLERAFAELSQKDPSSLLVDVANNDDKELMAGLTAPVCEIVTMRMNKDAPIRELPLSHSMRKTYTDCYRMQGFTGGNWGYTLNTNLVGGERDVLPGSRGSRLESKDRKLAIYLLGWESIELHEDANKTPVFAEEMIKLGPWINQESGAWYVRFAT